MLCELFHCLLKKACKLGILGAENIVSELIKEEVTDDFVGACVALIEDILYFVALAYTVVPESLGNLSGSVNFKATIVFIVKKEITSVAVGLC